MLSCLIFGVGGHGWESIKQTILTFPGRVTMYTLTSDWGGFTGYWGRLLELHKHELNRQLHGKVLPVLPWGDLNKIVMDFAIESLGDTGKLFNFRSIHIDEIKVHFNILADELQLEHDMREDFGVYLECVDVYARNNNQHLPFTSNYCLGGLWHSYLYSRLGDTDELNSFYHRLKIIPDNIQFKFTANERQVLTGKAGNGVILHGEDAIDVFHLPVLPDSFELLSGADSSPAVYSKEFLDDLNQADIIIIPNGSIANWLPLITSSTRVREILRIKSEEKKLIWLLNLFRTANEFDVPTYVEYLYSIVIYPTILASKNLPEHGPIKVLERYEKTGKILNLATTEAVEKLYHLNHNIHPILECNINLTYKYDQENICQSINSFYHYNG